MEVSTPRSQVEAPDTDALHEDDDGSATLWEGRTVAEWRTLWGDTEPGRRGAAQEGEGARVPAPPLLKIFPSVGSTNNIARELAEAGAPGGSIVIADLQTEGRGRSGKSWHAPEGTALLISIILRPGRPLGPDDQPGTVPLRVGLAVADAIERTTGVSAQVKWPNDLLIRGEGKIAGILCEGSLTHPNGGFIIAGIGLNVGQSRALLDETARQPATSLALVTGAEHSRGVLAGAIYRAVMARTQDLLAPLDETEVRGLAERDPLLGHPITVNGEPAGIAHGIAPDGTLTIISHDGNTISLRNGTVRPVPSDKNL